VLLLSNHDRLLKKAHLLRCAQSPRSNVSVNTPSLVDSSRASHLDLFEQPGIRVFQQRDKYPLKFPASKPMKEFIISVHGGASGFEWEQTLIHSAFPTATHDLCIAIDSEWQPE
jgi:hypothetical protein